MGPLRADLLPCELSPAKTQQSGCAGFTGLGEASPSFSGASTFEDLVYRATDVSLSGFHLLIYILPLSRNYFEDSRK